MKRGLKVGMWIVIGAVAIGVFGWVTMILWNWLIPNLFSGPVITMWQALGLLVLSKILFGSIGKGHHRNHQWGGYWKQRLNSMSPEDREKFKQKMKDKWCYRDPETFKKESSPAND